MNQSLIEAESIEIIREAVSTARNPVMLYSVGKDSSVMLHLARKAFFPSELPFPLLHVDTGWKFKAMYAHRDKMITEFGIKLLVHVNPRGKKEGVGPFSHSSDYHTDVMKTQGLKQALDANKFDVVFGGARRDEEKSRAKERIFSFRDQNHHWNPKAQRPELWNLYNNKIRDEESLRVFPLSNWTETDIWHYIWAEEIPIVPLYLAAKRKVVRRNGQLIMVDDERFPAQAKDEILTKSVRFRTLGCWPLTAAIESEADTLEKVIEETLASRNSERQGRLIDSDRPGSMEKKKQEGYF